MLPFLHNPILWFIFNRFTAPFSLAFSVNIDLKGQWVEHQAKQKVWRDWVVVIKYKGRDWVVVINYNCKLWHWYANPIRHRCLAYIEPYITNLAITHLNDFVKKEKSYAKLNINKWNCKFEQLVLKWTKLNTPAAS